MSKPTAILAFSSKGSVMESEFRGIKFSDKDVVETSSFIPKGEYNPHNVRPWIIYYNQGYVLCVVFASHEQEAFDIACDEGKLDRFLIDTTKADVREEYMTTNFKKATGGLDPEVPEFVSDDGDEWWWKDSEPAFLGNASEPFDLSEVGFFEMPNPAYSWVAMFNASKE